MATFTVLAVEDAPWQVFIGMTKDKTEEERFGLVFRWMMAHPYSNRFPQQQYIREVLWTTEEAGG